MTTSGCIFSFLLYNTQGKSEPVNEFLTFINPLLLDGNIWPDEDDLVGIIISLCRIKITWDLNPFEFTKGHMVTLQSHAKLTVDELQIIAEDRIEGKDGLKSNNGPEWAIAIEFLEAAYQ